MKRAFVTAASLAAAVALAPAYAADSNTQTAKGTQAQSDSVNAAPSTPTPPSAGSNTAATDPNTAAPSPTYREAKPAKEPEEKHGFFHKLFHPSEWGAGNPGPTNDSKGSSSSGSAAR
jgi:hypothetical protein